jgi:BioD-like phosphotransacetylase family protein
MHRLVIASMRRSAGKTSIIVGLGQASGKKIGYLKPFGDRLLYRKKRLWDYDAALIENIFKLEDNPEELSIGFDHSKLRFMYSEETTRAKLEEMIGLVAAGRDLLVLEAGRELSYGVSVHLDAVSLARATGGTLIFVLSGDEGTILDDATFIRQHVQLENVKVGGLILNRIGDVEDFRATYLPMVQALGMPVLGLLPQLPELSRLSLAFLSESLFAKVIAGEEGLGREVKQIFVGAMSTDAALRNPLFTKPDKIVITSGDRSDMILAALDGETAAIVLTNNILPPANLISLASERKVPLLLVSMDTYETAKQIDAIEPLLTQADAGKIELLGRTVKERVDLAALLQP